MAARSRYADTNWPGPLRRTWRNPSFSAQAWKLERLQAAGIAIPQSLMSVPVDFERQTLAAGLEQGRLRLRLARVLHRGWE